MTAIVKASVDDPELVRARQAQLAAAAARVFSRQGFHPSTIKDIAREAGISTGLVYQYVVDKRDVLFLALSSIMHATRERLPAALDGIEPPLARLAAVAGELCRAVDENRDAVMLLYRETESLKPEHQEALRETELEANSVIVRCIEQCIVAGLLAPTNAELLAFRIVISAHAWALKHWRLRQVASLDEYVRTTVRAAWEPLLTEAGRRALAAGGEPR